MTMEGLLKRISAEGSEAQNALRVVAFFDQLVEHRSSPHALVRSTARLIGAPAGYSSESGGESWSFDAIGRPLGSSIPSMARVQRVATDRGVNGVVWILPDTKNSALADLVVERMALSAAIVLDRDPGQAQWAETASVHRLIDAETSEEDRVAHAHALGFRPNWRVRAIVLKDSAPLAEVAPVVKAWSRACSVRCTVPILDEEQIVAICQDADSVSIASLSSWPGLVALGPSVAAAEAVRSLRAARQAVRVCSRELGPKVVDYDSLGAVKHIAAITPETALEDDLVKRFEVMFETDVGRAELKALDAFCRHTSLRSAAAELNLHHSSLANRLENASRKLGLDLAEPSVRFEVSMSLWLLRVAQSA
ncbi:PucR family transcriptional regulator [uncultured Amnibacterium sp.]|uniref:PucR family transcriptional regulator n=1 Tax=uncultured Amnibacterium sp. TaxID=1631851 RepID=UPI0035C9F62B